MVYIGVAPWQLWWQDLHRSWLPCCAFFSRCEFGDTRAFRTDVFQDDKRLYLVRVCNAPRWGTDLRCVRYVRVLSFKSV